MRYIQGKTREQPLQWSKLETDAWSLTWKFKSCGWRWKWVRNFHGVALECPIGVAIFTVFSRVNRPYFKT